MAGCTPSTGHSVLVTRAPAISSALRSLTTVTRDDPYAASPVKLVPCSAQSAKSGNEAVERSNPNRGTVRNTMTRSLESRYGSGRSNTPLTTLKTAVFAPIPSASVSTATRVKPGCFPSERSAYRRSFMTERLHGIDPRRPPRWDPAREQGHRQQDPYHGCVGDRVTGGNAVEEAPQQPSGGERPSHSKSYGDRHDAHSLTDDHAPDVGPLRAERHADADFGGATRDRERQHPIEADRRERQRHQREQQLEQH